MNVNGNGPLLGKRVAETNLILPHLSVECRYLRDTSCNGRPPVSNAR